MDQKRKVTLLRISYWTGAIFDALVVLPLLFPKIASAMFGLSDFAPEPSYRYVGYVAASLMAGWTFLLIWADRKPLERRGVLVLTIFPVLFGLILSGIFAVTSGFVTLGNITPTFIMQGVITTLFGFSYFYAEK